MEENAVEVELRNIRETLQRIEGLLEKQNGRLRVVENEQARQGVYSGFISAAIAGTIAGAMNWLGIGKQ